MAYKSHWSVSRNRLKIRLKPYRQVAPADMTHIRLRDMSDDIQVSSVGTLSFIAREEERANAIK